MRDRTSDIGRKLEGISTCDEHMHIWVIRQKGTNVTFYLETGTIDGSGKHVSAGVMSQQDSFRFGINQRKESRMLVHGIEPQLHAWRDGTTQKMAIGREEVVGDTGACIYNEEGVVRVLDNSPDISSPTICAISSRHACDRLNGTRNGGGEP